MLEIFESYHFMQFQGHNDPKSRKWRKTSFWAWFRPVWAQNRANNLFFKNLVFSVTRYHDQLSDGRTDGQTDEIDFIGRYPTNVERPLKSICLIPRKIEMVMQYIKKFINLLKFEPYLTITLSLVLFGRHLFSFQRFQYPRGFLRIESGFFGIDHHSGHLPVSPLR